MSEARAAWDSHQKECLDCQVGLPCEEGHDLATAAQNEKGPEPKLLEKKETVNHPPHYNQRKIEVMDAIDDWNLNFAEGCIVKYVARHRHKNGLEDLRKAQWYLNFLIKKEEQNALSVHK